MTGFSHLTSELTGKRLQLLKDTLPRLRRVAALATQKHRQIEREATRMGLQIHHFIARQPGEIGVTFAAARAARPEALTARGGIAYMITFADWVDVTLRQRQLGSSEWRLGMSGRPSGRVSRLTRGVGVGKAHVLFEGGI